MERLQEADQRNSAEHPRERRQAAGPFFIDPGLIEDEKAFNDAFKSKVLLYLIEDAAKTKKANVFQMENPTYSAVAKAFDTDGENIFRGMESLPTYSDNARDEHGSEGVDEEVEQ